MQLLAKDHRLTHMFAFRAERRVFSYGVTTLALLSAAVLLLVDADTQRLLLVFAIRRAHRIHNQSTAWEMSRTRRSDLSPPNPLTSIHGVGDGRPGLSEGGIRCDSQRYVARYCRRYLARREREMSVEGHMDPSSRCVGWGSRNGARAARWRRAR